MDDKEALARSWSGRDAFIYAFFSINLVTLGLYIISQAWCFILWLWTPIYADILRQAVLVPLAAVLGLGQVALALSASPLAWFVACVLMCLFILAAVARGMESYARMQRLCFWIGNAGLLVVVAMLLRSDKSGFKAAFDSGCSRLFGLGNAYDSVNAAGEAAGATTPLSGGSIGQVLLLLPCLAFFNLWPNCGASLSGEMRGAESIRRNLRVMGGALIVATALVIALMLAIDKAIGWKFYMNANAAYWSARQNPGAGPAALPFWPYPALLAIMTIPPGPFSVLVLLAMSAWFFGWAGTIYLSSSRIVFSAAFDRLLPAGLAQVDARSKSPFKALLFMVVPGLIVSALYVWNIFNFASLTLVSTAVIAVTFLGTGVAAVALPFAKKETYRASPLASFRIGRIPLISVFGLAFCAFIGYLLFEWLIDPLDLYGISLRNATSVVFMLVVYLLAILLYLGLRGFRRRSGENLDSVFEDKTKY